jgi:hypothetical protein
MGEGEGQTRQTCASTEVDPALPRHGRPDRRQAECVVEVALPQPRFLAWAEEPESHRIAVGALERQERRRVRLERGLSGRLPPEMWMFHVKLQAGRITTRRWGSSPRLSVVAPSTVATASWTTLRSAGVIG